MTAIPASLRRRLDEARVGRLATVAPDGRPHIVPCCFALVGDTICSAVDAKPKRSPELQRLRNLRADPRASLLVDHYEEDWSALWWLRIDGEADVAPAGPRHDAAIRALRVKYPQYQRQPPPGPTVLITPRRWRTWP